MRGACKKSADKSISCRGICVSLAAKFLAFDAKARSGLFCAGVLSLSPSLTLRKLSYELVVALASPQARWFGHRRKIFQNGYSHSSTHKLQVYLATIPAIFQVSCPNPVQTVSRLLNKTSWIKPFRKCNKVSDLQLLHLIIYDAIVSLRYYVRRWMGQRGRSGRRVGSERGRARPRAE